jgi:preprotein translocase subunit SecA
MGLFSKLFGTYSEREIKRILPVVDKIEALSDDMARLSDDELRGLTPKFKERLNKGETLDDILPEAFAAVREASVRVLNMRHFRVQLIGGIVLHQGRIAEMKTGEGKTLVATLPVYLNALTGKGVHVVTVNDYLAKRDSDWMGKVYEFLGLSVGLIVHGLNSQERRYAYNCDVTYGTNNEFGFDYLRDNMVLYKEDMVQRGHHFAIVDEVDSILIDEARTPLIISGAGEKSTDMYQKANAFALRLKPVVYKETDDKEHNDDVDADYIVDEKAKTVTLTAKGIAKAESFFGVENLSDIENMELNHHINQALRAHGLMKADIDYVVKDNEIIIVDEFTGRLMYGRRYSAGLHQAIEAKEGVTVNRESKTLATITFQNYFRMYEKLSGMTGTALTEEEEFRGIYNLDVIAIPPNKEVIRIDHPDKVYKNQKAKFEAVVNDIMARHEKGQPLLIGTISIEKSELLSTMLRKRGIKHQVLNAKYHDKEAEIIAQAGKYKAVTIATNMAGRGTDIVLGGNAEYLAKQQMRKEGYDEQLINKTVGYESTDEEIILNARARFKELLDQYKAELEEERKKVLEAGGLCVIGTERHESRRIDNQLRGRSGRQGDPGESVFYIALDDDLMRLFGQDRLINVVNAMGMDDSQELQHKMLSNAIEKAQKRVEGQNFAIRKSVLEYDDVMNKQREVIYGQRKQVLNGESLRDYFIKMIEAVSSDSVDTHCLSDIPDDWDMAGLAKRIQAMFGLDNVIRKEDFDPDNVTKEDVKAAITEAALNLYYQKEEELGEELIRELERVILLRAVDKNWMDHIDAMEDLKHGIRMRAYAQKDPVVEYKMESFDMFEEMIRNIREESVQTLFRMRKAVKEPPKRENVARPIQTNQEGGGAGSVSSAKRNYKPGRNDPCPCGSGKKYKNCCGRN